MTIQSVEIENIRGFKKATLKLNLLPNQVSILVAPNGFGKSSISTAFKCATGSKLNIDESDKHKKDITQESRLKLTYNKREFCADAYKNEISKEFKIQVIKSNLTPKAKMPRANGFPIAKPYLEMPDLDCGPSKEKTEINFAKQNYDALLGKNKKLLPNFSTVCRDEHLRSNLLEKIEAINKLSQARVQSCLRDIFEHTRTMDGSKKLISEKAEKRFSSDVERNEPLFTVFSVLDERLEERTWLEKIIICHYLCDLNTNNKKNLKDWLKYGEYLKSIKALKKFVESVSNAWVKAQVKETKGRIIITFPDATSLSNGQRDLLYFACKLYRDMRLSRSKPCILVIDEVFDYLDDANIAVAQYYLSSLIDSFRQNKREIYICLLTHLDPAFFRGYALKRQKTIFLETASQRVTEAMTKIINNRNDEIWKADIEKYFLHYHPDNCDITKVVTENFEISKNLGTSHGFYRFLEAEWKRLALGNDDYDPFAVCTYTRIKIEECAYRKLTTQESRDQFLNHTNGTSKKLKFAESVGVEVPEVCTLLGVVYNEALHNEIGRAKSSAVALKLKNLGLRNMIEKAIDW